MIRNEISDGVKLHKTSIPDVIVCKLDKSYFRTPKEIFIVNSYIKPANTSSKGSDVSGSDILNDLDSLINGLLGKGSVILCGDFNARIGLDIDFIKNDQCGADSFVPLPDDYIPQDLPNRNSQDKNANSYKRPFLEVLINNKLHILNGRTLGDSKGEFTCVQVGGASVVDYFIVSPDCSQFICHMTVKPLTYFSDHRPLILTLNFSPAPSTNIDNRQLHELYGKAPLRYKIPPHSQCNIQKSMEKEVYLERASDILKIEWGMTIKVHTNLTIS